MRFIRNALLIATATYTLSGCGDKEEIKEGDDNEPGEDGGGADAPIIKLENPGSGKCSNDLGLLKRQVEEANAKEAELLQKVKALEAMTGRSESSAKPQGRLVALQEENLAKEAKLKKAELEINTIKGGLIGLKALLDGSSYQTRTGRVLVDTEIKEIKNRIKREQAKLQQVLNDKRDLEQDRARLEEQMNEQKLAIVIADEEKSNVCVVLAYGVPLYHAVCVPVILNTPARIDNVGTGNNPMGSSMASTGLFVILSQCTEEKPEV